MNRNDYEPPTQKNEFYHNSIDINSLPQETDNDKNTVESLKTVFSRDIPNLTTVIEGLSK